MLERVFVRLLASRLDRFVDGLDEDNLRVAIWKGEILLENLQLKPEAVDEALGLPVGLAWGCIGTLHLSIPWNALGALPLSVTLKDVTLVFRPLPDSAEWNEEEATRRQRRVKERLVQDRLRFLHTNKQQGSAGTTSSDRSSAGSSTLSSSIAARLVNSLLSSVLVCLSGVNLRYEWPTGPEGKHAAIGVTLAAFEISNDDTQGIPESAEAFSKRATASGLALYCDPECTPLSPGERQQAPAPHRYVLHPTSATLSLYRRSVPTATVPQLSIDVQLARVHVAISESQLDRLNAMQVSFKAVRLREEVSRWRPRLPPTRDPRAWWRYAYQCIRSKQGAGRKKRPLDWSRLVFVVTSRQRYINLYKRRVAADLYSPLSPEEAEDLLRMEDRLHVAEIVYFRTLADAEVSHEEALAETSLREQRKGEFAVMGWVRSAVRTVTGSRPALVDGSSEGGAAAGGGGSSGAPLLMSEAERRALHEAIEYEATIAQATVPDHFSMMELVVSLNEGTLSLLESETRPVGRLILDATLKVVRRPHSWTLDVALGALEVFDLDPASEHRTVVTTRRTLTPNPMMKVGDYRVVKNAEARVDFNTSGKQGGRDLAVQCTVFPFQIYYSRRLMDRLHALVNDPEVQAVRTHAIKELGEWRARQQARIYESIVQRQRVFLAVRVEAPVLLLPEPGKGAQRLLIVDLGELSMRNAKEEETRGGQCDEGEDRWALSLANMQVGLCNNASAYLKETQLQDESVSPTGGFRPIIEAFDLNFRVRTWVQESSHSLSRIGLEVELPRLAIHLTASTIQYLHRWASAAPRARGAELRPLEEAVDGLDSIVAVDDESSSSSSSGEEEEGEGEGAKDGQQQQQQASSSRRAVRTLALEFRAPDMMLRLVDDLQGRQLVDVAVGGLAGSVEAKGPTVEVSLEVVSLEVSDQHTFADRSFVPLLTTLATPQGGTPAHGQQQQQPRALASLKLVSESKSGIDMEVSLRPLQLQWNPETIAGLQAFFAAQRGLSTGRRRSSYPPTTRLPLRVSHSSPPSQAAAISSSIFSSNASVEDGRSILAGEGQAEMMPVRLTVRTGQLTLLLNKEGEQRRMLDLTIGSAEIRFQAQGKTKELVGRIEDLRATDLCNLGTVYPRVLQGISPHGQQGPSSTTTGAVIHVKYVSRPATSRLEPDNLLEIDVSPLEVVYLNQYCLEVVDYLCEGVLGDAITGTIRSADSLVRQKLDAKTAFRLRVLQPRLIAPRVLRCPHHALVTLQEATLTTVFDVNRVAGEDLVMRHLVIGLQGLDLRLISPPPVSPTVLASPLSLTLEVSRALDPDYASLLSQNHDIEHLAALTVKGRIPGVRLEATPATHAFIRRIVDDNLMTSRHHAEEALRALRVVDLKPRTGSRPDQQQLVEDEGDEEEEGGEEAGQVVPIASAADGQCPQCGIRPRDDPAGGDGLLHTCPQCGTHVCRRCLAVSVFDKASAAVCRICRVCAAETFPLLFSGDGNGARVSYGYGLTDNVRLIEIKVVIELVGLEVWTLDDESRQTAQLTMEEMRIMWNRSEDNRKILDVSLYGCSIRDVATTEAVSTHGGSAARPPVVGGFILSPHGQEETQQQPQQQQSSVPEDPSSPGCDAASSSSRSRSSSSLSPQLVYRHSSSPLEASSTSIVLNHLTIVVLFTPLLRIYRFFTDLGPDPLPPITHAPGPTSQASPADIPPEPPAPPPSSPGHDEARAKATGMDQEVPGGGARQEPQVQVVDRIKIMVHHPRIIFPEAEDDVAAASAQDKPAAGASGSSAKWGRGRAGGLTTTAAAALVVRGLGVATYIREVERRGEEVLPRTSWTAELSRLECFICHKDGSTGELDLATGVSLLNPMSCSLVFTASYSLLRLPLRRVHLALDNFLTMYLSYQDVHTFKRVLEGWYRANIGMHRGKVAGTPMARAMEQAAPPAPVSDYYEVAFFEQKLGLTLRRVEGVGAVVDSKQALGPVPQDGSSSSSHDTPPFVGDVVVSVGGHLCDHAQAVTRIRSMPRPLSICFRRRSVSSPSLSYKVHVGLEEVVFHRSKVPDCVMVADKATAEVPQTAMLVSVAGRSVEGLGYAKTMEFLRQAPSPTTLEVRHLIRPPPAINDLEIQIAGVSVLAIDDCDGRDLPLLRAQVSEGQAFIRRVGQGPTGGGFLKGAARLELLAEYYNGRIAVWEPLLEKVPLTASLKRSSGANADTVMRLTAAGPVNLTLTDAALELLLHTRDEWLAQRTQEGGEHSEPKVAAVLSPPPASRSPVVAASPVPPSHPAPRPSPLARDTSASSTASHQSHRAGGRGSPYVLQNLTGLPIVFWTVEQESASGSSSKVLSSSTIGGGAAGGRRRNQASSSQQPVEIEAAVGSRVPFSVWQQSPSESGSSEAYRREYACVHTVFVRLSGPAPLDDAELTCLPMTKVGHYSYSLRPGGSRAGSREKTGGRKEIVWSVAVEAGRRILTLRSALELVNKSGLDLQLRCLEETLDVAAWSTFVVPLAWLMEDRHAIMLRVANSETHAWSQSLFRPKGEGLKEFVICAPLAPGPSPCPSSSSLFFYLDDVSSSSGASSIMTVNLSAGLTFVNLLPLPLRYAWREGGGGGRSSTASEVGTIEQGEERAAARVAPLATGVEVCFKLDGFFRSEWVPLASELPRWTRRMKLKDERGPNQGDALCLLLDVVRTGRHAIKATVLVEFWLENLSGLPLVYGEPVKAAVETLAGPITSEVVMTPFQESEVVEELFEVRVKGGSTRWGTELGRPLAPKDAWRLPCAATWQWLDQCWKVDLAGAVEQPTGWESSRLDYPDAFRPGRTFKGTDRIARRRWVRRRAPVPSLSERPAVALFQPRAAEEGGTGTQLSIKAGDSCWSSSLDVGLEGAGGAFQVIGNRWPNLDDMSLCRTLYELTYSVRAAPAPWDRTRIVSFQSRYTIRNDGSSRPVRVAQAGVEAKAFELGPGMGQSFHWPDFQRSALVVVSLVDEQQQFQWSGPVDISSIADIPLIVRGRRPPPDRKGATIGSGGWELVEDDQPREGTSRRVKKVAPPWSRIVRVQVELGGGSTGSTGRFAGAADRKLDKAAMTVSLTEVTRLEFPVSLTPEGSGRLEGRAVGEEDLPLIWLENATNLPIFYGQVSCVEEDELSPMTVRCFGWDSPMGEGDIDQDPYQIRLSLSPGADPRQSGTVKVISPNEVGSMVTLPLSGRSSSGAGMRAGAEVMAGLGRGCGTHRQERWAVQVTVTTDGPSKVLRFRLKDLGSDDDDDQEDEYAWSMEEELRRRRRLVVQERGGKEEPEQQQQRAALVPVVTSVTGPSLGGGGGGTIKALVTMPSVLISVVDDKPEEVLVLGLEDLALEADSNWRGTSGGAQHRRHHHVQQQQQQHMVAPGERRGGWRAQLEVGLLQVDNHQAKAHFPVVLRPAELQDTSNKDMVKLAPCIRLTLDLVPRPSLVHLRALRLAFRKFVLNLDQSTVHAVAHLAARTALFSRKTDSASTSLVPRRTPLSPSKEGGGEGGDSKLQQVLVCVSRVHRMPPLGEEEGNGSRGSLDSGSEGSSPSGSERKPPGSSSAAAAGAVVPPPPSLFVEALQVEALSINLSLSRPRESEEEVYVGLKLNRMLVDMMHRVDEARLKLQPFVMMHMITTPDQMWSLCTSHYSREVKRHIFSMLGSLRALGKPVALIRGFGKGASDFIHEPFQGLVRSVEEQNPEEFVYGVARGGTSLLRHTLGGVANSASCITDNISKQMSNLAFDREYKMQREKREARKDKPADVLEGLGSGGKRLAKGLVDGVFGVVSAPLKGAERDGLRGLVKGVGKGVIGLVVKPVVGLTDAATDVLRGVQSTTGASTADQLTQLRPKRATYGSDRRLRPYELVDAQAQLLLGRAGFGKDLYEDHADLGSSVALISTQRIIFLDEGGAVREVLALADVLFVEPVERLASEAGLQPRLQTGAIIHSNVKLEGGEVTTRRLYVPCETLTHSRAFKCKIDQALLASQTAGLLS